MVELKSRLTTPETVARRPSIDETLVRLPQSIARPLFEAFAHHGLSALDI